MTEVSEEEAATGITCVKDPALSTGFTGRRICQWKKFQPKGRCWRAANTWQLAASDTVFAFWVNFQCSFSFKSLKDGTKVISDSVNTLSISGLPQAEGEQLVVFEQEDLGSAEGRKPTALRTTGLLQKLTYLPPDKEQSRAEAQQLSAL